MQIGGWRVDYEGLSFVTVRNAGHMVRSRGQGGPGGVRACDLPTTFSHPPQASARVLLSQPSCEISLPLDPEPCSSWH
jgi:hypothetical protein